MTRQQVYKALKQEKLFSVFCAYLATCYEMKFVANSNFACYYYKQPKNKLDEFIKSYVETRKTPDDLVKFIKGNWKNWIYQPKIIYGGKKYEIPIILKRM